MAFCVLINLGGQTSESELTLLFSFVDHHLWQMHDPSPLRKVPLSFSPFFSVSLVAEAPKWSVRGSHMSKKWCL